MARCSTPGRLLHVWQGLGFIFIYRRSYEHVGQRLTLPLLTANADPPTGHLSGETRDRDLDMYAEEQSSRGEGSDRA